MKKGIHSKRSSMLSNPVEMHPRCPFIRSHLHIKNTISLIHSGRSKYHIDVFSCGLYSSTFQYYYKHFPCLFIEHRKYYRYLLMWRLHFFSVTKEEAKHTSRPLQNSIKTHNSKFSVSYTLKERSWKEVDKSLCLTCSIMLRSSSLYETVSFYFGWADRKLLVVCFLQISTVVPLLFWLLRFLHCGSCSDYSLMMVYMRFNRMTFHWRKDVSCFFPIPC